jgi:serine-type D-Ala-D-Ala carboxypeptidase (penicillin-binding protein 5/6)
MRRAASLLCAAALALLPVGSGVLPAAAAPSSPVALPTVDPAAPTPTAPLPGGPPTGAAPDGSTVGGPQLATRGVVVTPGAPALPDGVTAPGWLVADLGSGRVLAARDPHGRYYPASTLKTLTLLTLVDRLPPDRVVTGTEEDQDVEGTRVGLVAGGQYPVWMLFDALILGSGNDAAGALARAAGGLPATLAAMDATARRLGAFDTVAGTPSGLDVAGQSSSPYDLALVFRALLADARTAEVLRTPRIQVPPQMGRPGFEVDNQDVLLRTYPGDLGGKNGFTDAARHTFVTAAERSGRRIVVTLMGAERRPVAETEQVRRLLDWGFATPAGAAGVGRLVSPGEVPATAPPTSAPPAPAAAPAAGPTAGAVRTAARARLAEPFPWVATGLAAVAAAGGAAGVLARRAARRRRVSGGDR